MQDAFSIAQRNAGNHPHLAASPVARAYAGDHTPAIHFFSTRMAEHAHEELEVLEREIKANLVSPSAETVAFLKDALKRLRLIPFSIDPERRINCLIDIASQFYHQGPKHV